MNCNVVRIGYIMIEHRRGFFRPSFHNNSLERQFVSVCLVSHRATEAVNLWVIGFHSFLVIGQMHTYYQMT